MSKLLKVEFGAGERGEKRCVGREAGTEDCFLQRWEPSQQMGKEEWEWGDQTQLKGGKGKWGLRVRKRARYRRLPQKVTPKERE